MLLPKVLLLCAFCHRMTYGHTAAGLRALANIHSHRAKALANALNLRARAQYNAAIAKSRASIGLYDHRFIRDSNPNFSGDEEDPGFDSESNEDFPFETINDSGEDIDPHLIQETIFGNGLEGQDTNDFILEQRNPLQVRSEDLIDRRQSEIDLRQEQPCSGQQFRENTNQGDLLQIPSGFDNLDEADKLSMYSIYEDGMVRSVMDDRKVQGNNLEGPIGEDTGGCLTCGEMMRSQFGDDAIDNRQISPDPNADTQSLLNQESGGPPIRFMNNQQAGIPSMELPSTVDFQNSNNEQQFSTMHPIFGTYPTTFVQQGNNGNTIGEGVDERLFEPQTRLQENDALPNFDEVDGRKSSDLFARHRLRPHGHVHTFSHSHFHGIQPLDPNIHMPTTQVIPPAVNLHVIQNQNAAVGPQFATTAIQPGFNTAVVNPGPVTHGPSHFSNINQGQSGAQVPQGIGHGTGMSQAQSVHTHSSQIMPNTQQFGHTSGGNIGHGSGVSQFQNIQTHSAPVFPGNQQLFTSPSMGGSTISQTQTVHQGARQGGPVDGFKMADGQQQQQMFDDAFLGQGRFEGEKVGIFLDSAPLEAPAFHYPDQPENRQGVVKYIENEQDNIRRFLHIMENNNQYNSDHEGYEFNNNEPINLHKTEEYGEKLGPQLVHENNIYDRERDARQHIPTLNHMKNIPGELDKAKLAETNFQNEKVGTINMDHVSENFEEFESDLRHHLEDDERNVENILDQIGQNYRHGMDSLSSLINIDHRPHDSEHFQNYHDTDGHIQVQEVDVPDGSSIEHRPHVPEHFQNYHDTHPDGHIQVQEVDVPDGSPIEHRPHHPEYFQNYHNTDPDDHIQVQEVDVPDDDKTEGPHHFVDQESDSREYMNGKGIETLLDNNAQDRLGYIIQVPDRRYSEDYQRQARSLNKTAIAKLDKLLLAERQLINDLKKDAKHDEDMMMIGYIGDSIIDDLENRLNKSRRGKREIGRTQYLPLRRLATDPKAKLDMTKTLENLGAVTRHAFEHEKAPMYHVRNMVGSAQNAMMAAMKIPTKNFLIPSAYDIVSTQGDDDDVVAAINPGLFSRNGREKPKNEGPIDEIMTTFQRVGSAIRGSVKSGQEALNHVGDVANHAKSAIHSTKYTTPKLILKNIPAISREPKKKAMLITPRIFDISAEENQVGNTLGKREPDFVKVGHIMDAVGVSKPNYNLEFEKIVIEPRSSFADSDLSEELKIKHPNAFKDLLENIKIEKMRSPDDVDFLGTTLNTLDDARSTIGANNLQDFIVQMRHKFRKLLGAPQTTKRAKNWKQYEKSTQKIDQSQTLHENSMENHTDVTREIHTQNIEQHNSERQENHINNTTSENPVKLDEESVGISLLPEEIRHPFLGQATLAQRQQFIQENNRGTKRVGIPYQSHKQFMRGSNYEEVGSSQDKNQRDRDLGQILGAINPMMFERIFNETLKVNNTHTPHSMFHHHHHGRSHGHHHMKDESSEEKVGTSMAVKGPMLKPFMGQASGRVKQKFFNKYMPEEDTYQGYEYEESCSEETEFENFPELAEWVDIFHPFHESSVEYDE